MKLKYCIWLILLPINLIAQNITPDVAQKAESILTKMTLEEKIDYISGYNSFYIRSIPRLGVPEIRMADGPQGIRNNTNSAMFPCGVLSASTWDRELVYRLGKGLGQDARARGIHILLGPGVNIYRAPMCGRNFEYFGEDPYLTGEIAKQYIKGVQSEEVVATIKHFAGNNQEWRRHHVSSDIDERTLHEIYLPAFEKAVKEANVGAVMNSYNLLNSVHASENADLNIHILRNQWGFQGILMSDWNSVYSTVGAANGGLDLEMPDGKFMNKKALLPAINNGLITIETIDNKVRHILQTLIAFHFLNREQINTSIPENNPYSNEVALDLARNGVVLLKNDEKILPVTNKNILLLGPNAKKITTGGGSGFVRPFSTVSLLKGMQDVSKGKLNIDTLAEAAYSYDQLFDDELFTESGSSKKGFKAHYFKNKSLTGQPAHETIEASINNDWGNNAPLDGFPVDGFSIRWTGVYRPSQSGIIQLAMTGDDGYRIYVDEDTVLSDWRNHNVTTKYGTYIVEAGKEYKIKIEYYDNSKLAIAKFGYKKVNTSHLQEKLKKAQTVVLCMGFDNETEKEGSDRTFALPKYQEQYIDLIANYHRNIIVVLNAGGGVDVSSWENKVKGIIMAWYPGQQGGLAVAEIITGKISPSGKLPISIEKRWEDNPVYNSYYDNRDVPHQRVQYNEGVFIGYRGYERNNVQPRYPFGFGLSYTEFEYSDLLIKKEKEQVIVSFSIKNTGKYDAAEISQIYVSEELTSVPRPIKELKGFDKVYLKKGESKRVQIALDQRAFAYYDVIKNDFSVNKGEFKILVGASSSDIRLIGEIMY